MEMTNNCNLNCHNCGTPTTGYKKDSLMTVLLYQLYHGQEKGRP